MLVALHIRGLALIEEATLEFDQGLHVLTGETGAGKSIIVGALQLAIGGRASAEVVRSGVDAALVEAEFALPDDHPAVRALAAEQLWEPGESVVLGREVSRQGRNKCRINGRLVSASLLAEIGAELVEIHGQHENQRLLDPEQHLALLDAVRPEALAPLKAEAARAYGAWRERAGALDALKRRLAERAGREAMLRFQIEDVEKANLTAGEDAALQAERARLLHVERLRADAARAYAALSEGEANAVDLTGEALSLLTGLLRYDGGLEAWVDRAAGLQSELQDLARELHLYLDGLEADPERLTVVDRRLDQLERLTKRYATDLAGLIAQAAAWREELAEFDDGEARTDALEREVEAAAQSLRMACAALTAARRETAEWLASRVGGALSRLGMPGAELLVEMTRRPDAQGLVDGDARLAVRADGWDYAEFLLAANPGEPPLPLARTASGGELSRVMLALRAEMANQTAAVTLVFDEVDQGIGGRTALAVAERLHALGRTRQVLCVTHLAQIAGSADQQWVVEKLPTGERTGVRVGRVEGEVRLAEIARMLGGAQTASSIEHARELLQGGERAAP
ncbi:MAG TPA: DNA repair protein RecN [Limnochordia bacterium]|nr:DNA repair protein RecN [Limnochordia bacterium]